LTGVCTWTGRAGFEQHYEEANITMPQKWNGYNSIGNFQGFLNRPKIWNGYNPIDCQKVAKYGTVIITLPKVWIGNKTVPF
jgi:hypothetical protein